jgi:hypothetical protein
MDNDEAYKLGNHHDNAALDYLWPDGGNVYDSPRELCTLICIKVNPSQYIRTYEAGARLLTLCSERLATSVQLVPQSQPCVV